MMTREDLLYLEHTVRLDEPTVRMISEQFAVLPRPGCLEAVCCWERRLEILSALEAAGALAIHLKADDVFSRVRIVALKGRGGACYDTGRKAVYLGDAVAVLDDDRHLIVGTIRVCEKTGGVYRLWPYRGQLSVTDAESSLLARLDRDRLPFDCNTFDTDSRRLVAAVGARRPSGTPSVAVVYPGPFRVLVLNEGTVVRRGVAIRVPESSVNPNGFLRLPPAREQEACLGEHYAMACAVRGAAFILDPPGDGGSCAAVSGKGCCCHA